MKQGKPSESSPSRYVVGFDLGTTNSAVTYVDTAEKPWRIRTFAVPQLVAPGQVEARETLPSFHYQAAAGELAAGALRCPWHKTEPSLRRRLFRPRPRRAGAGPADQLGQVVAVSLGRGSDGAAAAVARGGRRRAALAGRGQRAVSRPTCATPGTPAFPRDPLAEQDFVLTLPASFDEVARELTVKAAALAGLAARRADRGAAGRLLRLDLRPRRRLGPAGRAGPEDSRLRHRRRHVRFHADSRPPRRRRARCSSIAWPSATT